MNLAFVNRIEVIDSNGRAYKQWTEAPFEVVYDLQDGGRTLKIFVAKGHNIERRCTYCDQPLSQCTARVEAPLAPGARGNAEAPSW